MTVLWGGLLLSVTQSLTVSKSPGVKGWLGTCWELSFILPVAPEGVCGCTVCSGGEKKQVVLVLLLGRGFSLRCQGSASNGWILVEVLIN